MIFQVSVEIQGTSRVIPNMATKNPTDYEVTISLPDHYLDEKVPVDCRGVLTIKFAFKTTKGFRSVQLKKRSSPLLTLSIVGGIGYGSQGGRISGQCVEEIRKIWGHIPEVAELCDLWIRWHSNDMTQGTVKQMEAVRSLPKCPASEDWFDWTCAQLGLRDLLVDRGYSFGNEWLFDVIPATIVKRIKTLAKKIDPSP